MLRQIVQKFRKAQEGVASIEFAILAVPFLAALFATIELSYKSFVQTALDNNLYTAASQISIIGFDYDSPKKFVDEYVCTDVASVLLRCEEIEIGVKKIPLSGRLSQYREQSVIGEWDLGCAYDALLIEINYPITDIAHPIAVADIVYRDGQKYYRSRGVVRREPVLSGPGAC
ncbi:MAG: TadE/TadG family type IV pilus assembly protein [Pseudomonadota bacterium]